MSIFNYFLLEKKLKKNAINNFEINILNKQNKENQNILSMYKKDIIDILFYNEWLKFIEKNKNTKNIIESARKEKIESSSYIANLINQNLINKKSIKLFHQNSKYSLLCLKSIKTILKISKNLPEKDKEILTICIIDYILEYSSRTKIFPEMDKFFSIAFEDNKDGFSDRFSNFHNKFIYNDNMINSESHHY